MQLWLIDCGQMINRAQLDVGAEVGFNALLHYLTITGAEERAQDCDELGLESIFFLPDWRGQPISYGNFPFYDAAGRLSYTRGIEQRNLFPDYWHHDPSIEAFIHARFREAYDLRGKLDGAVVSTSAVECKMPVIWDDDTEGRRTAFWCFSEPARKAWRALYGDQTMPAPTPHYDLDGRTRQFCQDAMIDRLTQVCEIALAYTQKLWVFISRHCWSRGLLYKSAGYFGLHVKLHEWRKWFMDEHGVEPGFFIPALYMPPPEAYQRVHELTDPAGDFRWQMCVGLQCDQPDWRENILRYGELGKHSGMAAMCADYDWVTRESQRDYVANCASLLLS